MSLQVINVETVWDIFSQLSLPDRNQIVERHHQAVQERVITPPKRRSLLDNMTEEQKWLMQQAQEEMEAFWAQRPSNMPEITDEMIEDAKHERRVRHLINVEGDVQ